MFSTSRVRQFFGEYWGKTVNGLKIVFVGGEYWEITLSGLKMFFVGGEYWDITVSGLKMGNNSQWAENVFFTGG